MRFQITMNMPSRSGNSVHQVICEYPAESLSDFVSELVDQQILVVEEIYRDNEAPKGVGDYYKVGDIAINYLFAGKIKSVSG